MHLGTDAWGTDYLDGWYESGDEYRRTAERKVYFNNEPELRTRVSMTVDVNAHTFTRILHGVVTTYDDDLNPIYTWSLFDTQTLTVTPTQVIWNRYAATGPSLSEFPVSYQSKVNPVSKNGGTEPTTIIEEIKDVNNNSNIAGNKEIGPTGYTGEQGYTGYTDYTGYTNFIREIGHSSYKNRKDTSTKFWNEEAVLNLSTPYKSEDVIEDINGLLSKWNLADDIVYPWRQDNFLTVAPLVSYNEVDHPVSPLQFVNIPGLIPVTESPGRSIYISSTNIKYFDSNSLLFYNGEVLGEPLPAGYNSYYDYRHITWRCCIGDDGDEVPYPYKYGAWSHSNSATDITDGVVPATATQWTDNLTASTLWPGAWISNRVIPVSEQVWAQKWAETIIPRPSINFARPCGADRYQMDKDTVRCILSIVTANDNDPHYSITLTESTTIVAGNVIMVYSNDTSFGAVITGVWTVHEIGVAPLTLLPIIIVEKSKRVVYATPTGVTNPGVGLLGKLRWPNAPAICGRIKISTAAKYEEQVVITFANTDDGEYLRAGDSIIISGAAGYGAINGTWELVTPPSSAPIGGWALKNCVGDGVYGGYGYATRVYTDSTHPYYVDDDNSKGDFLHVEWIHKYRDYKERERNIVQKGVFDSSAGCLWVGEINPLLREQQTFYGMPQSVQTLTPSAGCKKWDFCSPTVLCISPNNKVKYNLIDHWATGITKDFIGTLYLDERYGSLWQAGYFQHMPDPFWQAPPAPCLSPDAEYSCSWNEDATGICALDQEYNEDANTPCIKYYPTHPVVETRISCPVVPLPPDPKSIQTELPTGITINVFPLYAAPDSTYGLDCSGLDLTTGNILSPPTPAGCICFPYQVPLEYITNWGLYENENICVCNNTRADFATVYEQNGVLCIPS